MMSRSSNCFSRTSGDGGVTLEVFIWPSTTRFCSLTSYCVSASSLTMAITRSSGITRSAMARARCRRRRGGQPPRAGVPSRLRERGDDKGRGGERGAARGNARGRGRHVSKGHAGPQYSWNGVVAKTRRHGWIVGLLVARDAAAQQIEWISTEPRQSVQFDLQIDRIRRRLRGRRQSLADEPQGPAVGIVLDAGHGLQRLAVEEREVPPAEQRPARD